MSMGDYDLIQQVRQGGAGMSDIAYRTPACDKHLPNNENDVCPWCRIAELEAKLERVERLSNTRASVTDIELRAALWTIAGEDDNE
jgi:hypothetical protein